MKYDEHDSPVCPQQQVVSDWDDDGDEQLHWLEPCGTSLYLDRSGYFALFADMKPDDAEWPYPITDSWRVICEHGHVLLTSRGDEERAQPFDPKWLDSL